MKEDSLMREKLLDVFQKHQNFIENNSKVFMKPNKQNLQKRYELLDQAFWNVLDNLADILEK